MKTYLDCIPCFFKQALETSRLAGADNKMQHQILIDVAAALPEFPLAASPPEMGKIIYGLVKKHTGRQDPYSQIKEESNRFALNLYDQIKNRVARSHDRLLAAVKLAIAGNIIDYSVKNRLDVGEELKKILSRDQRSAENEDGRLFQYTHFKKALHASRTVLYLADNSGETVFDRILLEEIKDMDKNKEIIYAVKDKPIINDALVKDALDCGIDRSAHIISSGSDAPGTLLSLCSDPFLEVYRKTDMVISKGQGNFECLSGAERPVFFLLLAKCPVIASDAGCRVGEAILLYHHR